VKATESEANQEVSNEETIVNCRSTGGSISGPVSGRKAPRRVEGTDPGRWWARQKLAVTSGRLIRRAVPYSEGFSLGLAAFVRGAAVGDLSIAGAVRSLLPPKWALCLGRSVVTFLERRDPSRSRLQPQ
jgi:hypothetical protein